MSNLTNNTTKLEALLTQINELPNAGGGTDTSDATAAADEIFAGETAYTAGGKVTGTFTIEEELTEQSDLISQITTLVATKATPQGTNTNDATATASDIVTGKTAYAKGQKLVGTHTCSEDLESELDTQENLISQLGTILDNKASGGSGGMTIAPVYLNGPMGTTMYYIGKSGVEQIVNANSEYEISIPSFCIAYSPTGFVHTQVYSGEAYVVIQTGVLVVFAITGEAHLIAAGTDEYTGDQGGGSNP